MLHRQADKKRKEWLLLLDLYRLYVVKRPPSSAAFYFIELRPRGPDLADFLNQRDRDYCIGQSKST
jgi:hypothetical protein